MTGLSLTLFDLIVSYMYFSATALLFDAPIAGIVAHFPVIFLTGLWNNNISDQLIIDMFILGGIALVYGYTLVGIALLIVGCIFSAIVLLNINRAEEVAESVWHKGCDTRGPRTPWFG